MAVGKETYPDFMGTSVQLWDVWYKKCIIRRARGNIPMVVVSADFSGIYHIQYWYW